VSKSKWRQQLQVLVNNATTGHKLQRSGIDSLFVHNWSYVTNWPYVMLSRVKTRAGLFCRKKLSRDLSKYAVPERHASENAALFRETGAHLLDG
jgi:hypothetical protein